ncbi:MAG TPA: regulatory protein RecX [Bryobacteraceae bacterium]|nr:regulatory protein RecX [Bryobacteraceae bacterium]
MRKLKKVQKLAADALFEFAVKTLAGRASSSAELAAKLRLKAERAEDVDATIARLKDLNYLDDARFAESFAHARVENNGFGRMRVLSDLRARRVSSKLADNAVNAVFEEKDEDALIDAYIARRIPSLAAHRSLGSHGAHGSEEQEDRAARDRRLGSAYRRLQRAGFRSGAILAALKRAGAPEDLEEPDEAEAES